MEISIIPTKRTNCIYILMQKCTRAWTKLEEIRHIHFEIFVIPAKFYKTFKLTLFSFFKVMIFLSSYILYSSSELAWLHSIFYNYRLVEPFLRVCFSYCSSQFTPYWKGSCPRCQSSSTVTRCQSYSQFD